ncbi:unnamed protein product [Owenia fusiformis]|uniref:Uncharacterized protein n=1 Tax=Owenia fusiformis TaxID=6347 RepID=A0A8J1TNS9_OWEFU|nr:unnamed protein product [Owenia fusiformis]
MMHRGRSSGSTVSSSDTWASDVSERSLVDDSDTLWMNDSSCVKLKFSEESNEDSSRASEPKTPPPVMPPSYRNAGRQAQVTFEIVAANTVKEGPAKFVLYTVLVVRSPGIDTVEASVERRYSDFAKLNKTLIKQFPHLMKDVAFPKKMLTGNFKTETIAERSRGFEQYLGHIYRISEIRESLQLASFFYESDLKSAYNYLRDERYGDALPWLIHAEQLQERLQGLNNPSVTLSLCALVVCYHKTEQFTSAQEYADLALRSLGEKDESPLLVPLLNISIRLCWSLGMEKSDLEERLGRLRAKGIEVERALELKDVVMKLCKLN